MAYRPVGSRPTGSRPTATRSLAIWGGNGTPSFLTFNCSTLKFTGRRG